MAMIGSPTASCGHDAPREAAQQVEEDLAQVVARQVHRHRQAGREQRADGVAGQQHGGHGVARAPTRDSR